LGPANLVQEPQEPQEPREPQEPQVRTHPIFVAVYDRMNESVERRYLGRRRERLLGGLTGQVLDVGAGTGVNVGYFKQVALVVAAEPNPAMRAKLARRLAQATVPVELCGARAEALPFPDGTFDVVVFTLALCSIADPNRALIEAKRVLQPNGRLVVLEHVRGEGLLAFWQDRLAPVWSRFGAGCRPNRDTRAAITQAGFTFDEIEEFAELPRSVLTRTMMQGSATVARGPEGSATT
jgi:ubiquinone/menaquinone biosynthesis C-methylase UbiE